MKTVLLNRMRKMSERELYAAMYTDTLTGVLNRRAFEEMDASASIAMVDLDGLKYVNDNDPRGHRAGDELIRRLGQGLAKQFGDEHVYRISGDEFVICARDISAERMVGWLMKLQRGYLPAFSFGYGRDLEEADKRLREQKARREKLGLRGARGEARRVS